MRVILRRFHMSPDAGEPECVCSLCGKPFVEPEAVGPYGERDFVEDPDQDDAFPIRLFHTKDENEDDATDWEGRFHHRCFEQVFTIQGREFVPHPGVEIVWTWGDDAKGNLLPVL